MNHESITYVLHNLNCLTNENIAQRLIQQVVVGEWCFTVSLIEGGFEKLVSSALNISLSNTLVDTDQPIEVAYRTDSAHHGTVVLEPKDAPSKRDLSSLEPAALKRLVQGIAWRDAHFAGESMKAIADREGCSESYVRHTVAKGFDTLRGFASPTSSIN